MRFQNFDDVLRRLLDFPHRLSDNLVDNSAWLGLLNVIPTIVFVTMRDLFQNLNFPTPLYRTRARVSSPCRWLDNQEIVDMLELCLLGLMLWKLRARLISAVWPADEALHVCPA